MAHLRIIDMCKAEGLYDVGGWLYDIPRCVGKKRGELFPKDNDETDVLSEKKYFHYFDKSWTSNY